MKWSNQAEMNRWEGAAWNVFTNVTPTNITPTNMSPANMLPTNFVAVCHNYQNGKKCGCKKIEEPSILPGYNEWEDWHIVLHGLIKAEDVPVLQVSLHASNHPTFKLILC
jgi:hypothetical protein